MGPRDVVTPATNDRPYEGMAITVVRVQEVIEPVTRPIPFETVRTFTRFLRPGQVTTIRRGVPGEKLVHYRVRYENGIAVKRTVVSSVTVKRPVSQAYSIGSRGEYTSRGEFHTGRVLRMVATGYDPGPRSCGRCARGRTACGLRAGYGVAAVDPGIIRLGTKLYIEGYGYAIAGDRGRSIRGNRIDLGYSTYAEARRYGRRVVYVHLLEE